VITSVRRLVALCGLCSLSWIAIPPVASSSTWRVPETTKDRSDFRSTLVQGSEHVVLARVDSCGISLGPTVRCTALEYIKGRRFPLDRFTYFDSGDPPETNGARYLMFLTRSSRYGVVLTAVGARYDIVEDDRRILLPDRKSVV
jgi:hypothetical protein